MRHVLPPADVRLVVMHASPWLLVQVLILLGALAVTVLALVRAFRRR